MKNNYWLRHFLICQKMANECLERQGLNWQNFAALIFEEESGAYAISQMTWYFRVADEVIADISASDSGIVFDELEDTKYPQSVLATFSEDKMNEMYQKHVHGKTKI